MSAATTPSTPALNPEASPVSCQRMGQRVTQKSKVEFATALKAWRERRGLSQSQAAKALEMPVRSLQNWEIARVSPRGVLRTVLLKRFLR